MRVVAWYTRIAMGSRSPIEGPVELDLEFRLPRPESHSRSPGRAPRHHIYRPDRLKFARAVEDALSGIAYLDDAQTIQGGVKKRYCEPGEGPGVRILLRALDGQPGELDGPRRLVAE